MANKVGPSRIRERMPLKAMAFAIVCAWFSMMGIEALAQGNIRLGKLKVEPEVTYTASYDDNIFLESENEEDDFVQKLMPAIYLRYAGNRPGNYVDFGYKMTLASYLDYDENNYMSHNPFVMAGYRSPRGFYAEGEEQFLYTTDPYGASNTYGEGERTERWQNSIGLTFGYERSQKYGAEVFYRNNLLRYESSIDEWQNRINHQYGLSLFYKPTVKTELFTEYRETAVEYDEQNDGIDNWTSGTSRDHTLRDLFVGVRFAPGGKLEGEARIGYGEMDFDNSVDPFGRRYLDQDSWVAESEVEYRMSPRTRFSGVLSRSHKGAPDADASAYQDTRMGLTYHQDIGRRLAFELGTEWRRQEYEGERLNDRPRKYFHVYSARTGFEWTIRKWLLAGLAYEYVTKNANHSFYVSEEYKNNVVSVRVNAVF